MDALGKLLRSMIWDDTDAQNCEEMFNVSRGHHHTVAQLPTVSANVPQYPLHRKTALVYHVGPIFFFFSFFYRQVDTSYRRSRERGTGRVKGRLKSNANEEY